MDGPTMAQVALDTVQAVGGRTVDITRWADSYDPQTGVNTRTATTSTVNSTPLLPAGEGRAMRPGDTAARATGTIYVPSLGLGFVPREGDQVTIDGAQHTIVSAAEYQVETTSVVYALQLAKGGAVVA